MEEISPPILSDPLADQFIKSNNPSLLNHLLADPETSRYVPNKEMRQVRSGHFVEVSPTPLPEPFLVAYSPSVADLVGFSENFCSSSDFLNFFAGDMTAMGSVFRSWATPYALSIYGEEQNQNCPFKNGNGYGDGRAISVAEVLNSLNQRWELQLKGSGTTPFCRGGDGRAVLRSSVREFLASEAMHHLGISTTRALSLVVSRVERVSRPWFSDGKKSDITVNDPRLKDIDPEQRHEIIAHHTGKTDTFIEEPCAIGCRVAPSFIRVGQIELFARRYRAQAKTANHSRAALAHSRDELRLIVEHMMFREYDGPVPQRPGARDSPDMQTRILAMLRECSRRFCLLTADWIRVGFCQGNFNSDNCLAGGRTMDYGPFGFIEKYAKNWNMWSGGGQKYSFRNQHMAGERNFFSLASSIALLLDEQGEAEVFEDIIPSHGPQATEAVNDAFRRKLGLRHWDPPAVQLFERLDSLLEATEADYTIFFRQITYIPEAYFECLESPSSLSSDVWTDSRLQLKMKLLFANAFHRRLSAEEVTAWRNIIKEWMVLMDTELTGEDEGRKAPSGGGSAGDEKGVTEGGGGVTASSHGSKASEGAAISTRMRLVSPKYVAREWMLIEAYNNAGKTPANYGPLQVLQKLLEDPYGEHPEHVEAFYRKTPEAFVGKAGASVMT